MKKKLIYILGCTLGLSIASFGQSDKVKFGAISRGVVQESTLSEGDTLNPNRLSEGHALVDLRMNINPNKKTEIGTVVRMQSELGGFFGAGADLELRQLFVKGTLYDVVSYELGDIYLQMSPYTLYNNDGEGAVNEATVFKQYRTDVSNYDNFNIGNTWWSQGGHINFGLEFDSTIVDGIGFDLFTTRVQAPNTMRFMSGGKVSAFKKKGYLINANFIQLFDAKKVNPTQESLQNGVASLEGSYTMGLNSNTLVFSGEFGASQYKVLAPIEAAENYIVPEDKTGQFFTARAGFETDDNGVKVGARYLMNGSEFYSPGAQSKRINYGTNPLLFQNVANDPFNSRSLHLYDLMADRDIYNPGISGTLMAYDPRFGNALPYGLATPNRTGVIVDAAYTDSLKVVDVNLEFGLLSDVSGVGTTEKRSFTHVKAQADFYLNKILSMKKQIKIYGGTLFNKTTRGGTVSEIDLTSLQIDAGLDVEIFSKLYWVSGVKQMSANGNEFLFDLSDHNQYGLPTFYNVDVTELMFATGLRYQFSDNMYLSVKNFTVDAANNADSTTDYSFNQWMLFFSLKL